MALHCSHYWGRSHKSVRWDFDNADAQCYGCHRFLGSNPALFDRWKLLRLGQKRMDLLEYRARSASHFTAWDLEQIYQQLQETHDAQLLAIKNGYQFNPKITPI